MGHKCEYTSRLYIDENNHLIFETIANWKEKSLDVSRWDIDENKYYYRFGNIYFVNCGGWIVDFPNEYRRIPYYGGKEKVELSEYYENASFYQGVIACWKTVSDYEIEFIKRNKPEYNYLINKIDYVNYKLNCNKLFNLMAMWKLHPSEVETLAQKGLYNLALNNNLYKLSKGKKKTLVQALKQVNQDVPLVFIQQWIKTKVDFSTFYLLKEHSKYSKGKLNRELSVEETKYCQRKNIQVEEYIDMLYIANKLGKNIEDDYWHYPNNPFEIHQRVIEEDEQLTMFKMKKNLEKEMIYFDNISKVAKKNLNKPIELDNGYKLFIPTTVEEYVAAAEKLHQCIVSSQYYKKVAKCESLLFMIWKDNKPSSTVEINYDKKILQFYGDEHDRTNCKPTDYERSVFEKFLDTFIPKKVRIPQELKMLEA